MAEGQRRKTIWESLVEKKSEFIGGTLIDLDDDPLGAEMPEGGFRTSIVDLTFLPNGSSFLFSVVGAEFECSGDIRYLAVQGPSAFGEGLALVGPLVHRWDFVKPTKEKQQHG